MVNVDKAAKAGDFLFRYMFARYRCKHRVEPPRPPARWADIMKQGKTVFDEIHVELNASPTPIIWDDKHPDFFAAVIRRDNDAMPGLADLAYWRNYVHFNGPIPRRREPEPDFSTQARHWGEKIGATRDADPDHEAPHPRA